MKRNTSKLEEQGRKIIHRHPRRDLGAYEMQQIYEGSRGPYEMGSTMFDIGVAIGYRIAMAEQKARGKA